MFNSTKIIPLTIDLVVFSSLISGVRRAGGYQIATDRIPNDNAKWCADKYLDLGEFVVDQSISMMGRYPEVFRASSGHKK
ncbi:hypothetical protein M427DRAFT_50904 [Gonapodya prolifera JEL478]|uniref:Uncharacterized protein n=1 Tax=Gonapodya prolifera (strain JEL478) TaxID=1344416 RepID=A0A139AXN2_GONPJ|nr:hypothetical protein M427DRAFT_50904 [Gonapodya prolifera JEL478]|eukprot:KXS21464.1 hypothetical protein M427DRAFT_50904 [Gonapodya prolifera JEL478]